jgi:hypothetical protein
MRRSPGSHLLRCFSVLKRVMGTSALRGPFNQRPLPRLPIASGILDPLGILAPGGGLGGSFAIARSPDSELPTGFDSPSPVQPEAAKQRIIVIVTTAVRIAPTFGLCKWVMKWHHGVESSMWITYELRVVIMKSEPAHCKRSLIANHVGACADNRETRQSPRYNIFKMSLYHLA